MGQAMQSNRWRINPETFMLDREDGVVITSFTAQDWRAQQWPDCPVCGAPIDVAQVNIQGSGDPFPVYAMGAWQCPNHCDPRPVLRGAQ